MHERAAVRRLDRQAGRDDEADVMCRRAHEHEIAGQQPGPGRQAAGELLQARGVGRPTGRPAAARA